MFRGPGVLLSPSGSYVPSCPVRWVLLAVSLGPSDSSSLLKKLAQVQQIVDQELGAAPRSDVTSALDKTSHGNGVRDDSS